MPVERLFRGRLVKRTCRVGTRVVVILHGPTKGSPGPRLIVGLRDYLLGLQAKYVRPVGSGCVIGHRLGTDANASVAVD